MTATQKFFDVYISYPPGEDPERINECIRDNLSAEEANDVISALAEQRQAIIAEHCTNEERENAQHYFSYLGLDVFIRRSLQLAGDVEEAHSQNRDKLAEPIPQCPVCYSILEDPAVRVCQTCGLNLDSSSEAHIHRKRIEWQERIAFEHRKKHEIAYKLLREKQEEEKRLRKKIRAELEEQLMTELGRNRGWRGWFQKNRLLATALSAIVLAVLLLGAGFSLAKYFMKDDAAEQHLQKEAVTAPAAVVPTQTATPSVASGTAAVIEESTKPKAAAPQHKDLPVVSVPSIQTAPASQEKK